MNETAFRAHYEQYRDPLFGFGYRLTGSVEAAEDLVHDCFIGLYRGAFDERKGSIKAYLYGAMRNLALKKHREDGREEPKDGVEAATRGDQLEGLLSLETASAVKCAVEALPPLQREVLVLFEYEDLSLEEVSAIVGVDLAAVKSRLYRARESLRKSLAPWLQKGVVR